MNLQFKKESGRRYHCRVSAVSGTNHHYDVASQVEKPDRPQGTCLVPQTIMGEQQGLESKRSHHCNVHADHINQSYGKDRYKQYKILLKRQHRI